ncbi:DUF2306 domain-containing protein [Methylobacter sp. S3L5C]|uniref:DUF2306 domain-containing protein n=1 Tax=Methylobacter sp. S3L5C TaxID=2839024 RepID=UPI001FAE6506|nr:DUF2306 domain-containing protein [Methylobacter sp. S3L5C]UOA08259.1 DUF2306 domain-containing protein [Methylobacter sp. S3L5C]
MNFTAKSEWLIPTGLIALGFIPIVAGTFRVIGLASGIEITPDNARFFAAPLPVVLHIINAVIYCVLGAFQFSPSFRSRKPNWHRAAGRILIPCGLVVALSGLWMTYFYPPVNFDGPFLYGIRLLVGSAMVLCLCLGFTAICKRDIPHHRAWMIRGYALGLGAGTQVFTHIPMFLFTSIQGELARTLCMGAGWAINLAVAEWLISRERRRQLS